MASAMAQPIAGVSTNRETEIEAVYPSVAGSGLGALMGSILGPLAQIRTTVIRVPLMVAFGGLLMPLAIVAYAATKILGNHYIVTNRSVQRRAILGGAMFGQVALADIHDVYISAGASYAFYRVGDLHLVDAQGNDLLVLAAVPYPDRLRQVILDAREARRLSDASLAHIQGRG